MTSGDHPSNSAVQARAEAEIVAAAAKELGVELLRELDVRRVPVGGGACVEVDASTRDHSTVVEAYARQGKLKGAQLKKIGQDILKLALLCKHRLPAETQAFIAFASEEARQSVGGWLAEAAERFGVTLIVVNIAPELREVIIKAQGRQMMVNLDQAAGDITVNDEAVGTAGSGQDSSPEP